MNLKHILVALFVAPLATSAAVRTEPVDYVNPYIGTISHMLVPCYPTDACRHPLLRRCCDVHIVHEGGEHHL